MSGTTLKTIYFDESGFTGYSLLDDSQPVFVIASADIAPPEAEAILRESFPRYRANEFKFTNIWRSKSKVKDHIRLDALRVEDAGRQAQDRAREGHIQTSGVRKRILLGLAQAWAEEIIESRPPSSFPTTCCSKAVPVKPSGAN